MLKASIEFRRIKFYLLLAISIFITFGSLIALIHEKNMLGKWEESGLTNYIQSLPQKKEKLSQAVILEETGNNSYYVKVKFGKGESYEGFAKVYSHSNGNYILYRKSKIKNHYLFGYLTVEIYMKDEPINVIGSIKSVYEKDGAYYPGISESDKTPLWLAFVYFGAVIFVISLIATAELPFYRRIRMNNRAEDIVEETILEEEEEVAEQEEIIREKNNRVIRS